MNNLFRCPTVLYLSLHILIFQTLQIHKLLYYYLLLHIHLLVHIQCSSLSCHTFPSNFSLPYLLYFHTSITAFYILSHFLQTALQVLLSLISFYTLQGFAHIFLCRHYIYILHLLLIHLFHIPLLSYLMFLSLLYLFHSLKYNRYLSVNNFQILSPFPLLQSLSLPHLITFHKLHRLFFPTPCYLHCKFYPIFSFQISFLPHLFLTLNFSAHNYQVYTLCNFPFHLS